MRKREKERWGKRRGEGSRRGERGAGEERGGEETGGEETGGERGGEGRSEEWGEETNI